MRWASALPADPEVDNRNIVLGIRYASTDETKVEKAAANHRG
jgi:hypothetical protein